MIYAFFAAAVLLLAGGAAAALGKLDVSMEPPPISMRAARRRMQNAAIETGEEQGKTGMHHAPALRAAIEPGEAEKPTVHNEPSGDQAAKL